MNNAEKQLIEGLINTADKSHHNRCVELLFHGTNVIDKRGNAVIKKNPYVLTLENVVRKNFSGKLYFGRFDEVYFTFVTEFYHYLVNKGDALRKIEDLGKWLFTAAFNFTRNQYYRKKINDALGIETSDIFQPMFEKIEKDQSVMMRGQHSSADMTVVDTHTKIPSQSDDVEDDPDNSSAWAENLLNEYINQIPHDYYRLVLRVLLIEGMDRESFAEEQKKKVSAIYNDLSRAMDSLLTVALTDIRWRTKDLFEKYGYLLEGTKNYRELYLFYHDGKSVDELANELGTTPKLLQPVLVSSYKALQKIALKNRNINHDENHRISNTIVS